MLLYFNMDVVIDVGWNVVLDEFEWNLMFDEWVYVLFYLFVKGVFKLLSVVLLLVKDWFILDVVLY